MIAQIFSEPREPGYRVLWTESDGYSRERCFGSFRAAERFARQVECRLQIEAITEAEDEPAGHRKKGR